MKIETQLKIDQQHGKIVRLKKKNVNTYVAPLARHSLAYIMFKQFTHFHAANDEMFQNEKKIKGKNWKKLQHNNIHAPKPKRNDEIKEI